MMMMMMKTMMNKNIKKKKNKKNTVRLNRKSRIHALLKRLYYDTAKSPSAFTGKENVYRVAKRELPSITRRDVGDWFADQLTYTLHKPVRYSFRRNKTIVMRIDDQWQADLCDMSSRASDNDGYTFLLTIIDCFSKFAWAEALQNKSGDEILTAFQRILKRSYPRKPKRLQTDKGSEFLNVKVQRFLRNENIGFFTTNSEMKAAIVERFNRTLKTRMFKYFTSSSTRRYIDVLQSLVDGYNRTRHGSIKMRPIDVHKSHESIIRQHLYANFKKQHKFAPGSKLKRNGKKSYKYKIGALVRISKARRVFHKGYLPNWTEETFKVYKRRNIDEPFYYLRDYDGEEIKGGFYEHELQEVVEAKEYHIETVLSTKKERGGKTLYLVKWQGWPEKFNSWVEDIRHLHHGAT